jgi:hypothetical protein
LRRSSRIFRLTRHSSAHVRSSGGGRAPWAKCAAPRVWRAPRPAQSGRYERR